MTNTGAPITLRSLSDQRRRVWDTIQSLETAQITCDSPALQAALADKRAEWKSLNRQIAKGVRTLRARRDTVCHDHDRPRPCLECA